MTTNDKKQFKCHKCGHIFLADSDEYKMVFWRGDILAESYCPVCGAYIQINTTNFTSSGGGKF